MKLLASILTSGMMILALNGCGSDHNSTQSSHASALDLGNEVVRPTLLKDLSAKPTATRLPRQRAYHVTAQALVGTNSCLAAGVSAKFQEEVKGNVLYVKAVTVQSHRNLDRFCTMEAMPQYAEISTTLRFNPKKISGVVFKNVDAYDHDVNLADLLAEKVSTPTVVSKVVALPTNGGINPDAYAYSISGDVLLGDNDCYAGDATAKFETARKGNVIEVTAVITRSDRSNICYEIYKPVYAHIETEVRGNRLETRDVVVKNVDQMSNDVSVYQLIPRD